jgi:hypothetical protein
MPWQLIVTMGLMKEGRKERNNILDEVDNT